MKERALAWHPVPNINDGFHSISFCYESDASLHERRVRVVMQGQRSLVLIFHDVIALHFEDDCPGNFPLPLDLPRLNARFVCPLLKIENSQWAEQWSMWKDRVHYALLSLDDLVFLIAGSVVEAYWKDEQTH